MRSHLDRWVSIRVQRFLPPSLRIFWLDPENIYCWTWLSCHAFGSGSLPESRHPEGRLLALIPGIPPNGLSSTLIVDRHGQIAVRVIGPIEKDVLIALIIEVAMEN